MKLLIIASLILCLPLLAFGQKARKAFAYDYTIDDLPNGLRVITVPTDYPNLVALQIVVQTGSRNEPEKGKSGYAHLFEHLMFRGSEHYDAHQRDEILKKAGANDNAYTSDDRTVYHEVFSKDDLDKILELEADRFQRLKYPLDGYKTETKAVLGEFNKNSAAPEEKLFEVMRATAYQRHTYTHTTMGFIEDIEDDVLAKVLQAHLRTRTGAVQKDQCGPIFKRSIVGDTTRQGNRIVLRAPHRLMARGRIAPFAVFYHFRRPLEHANLADTCHKTPIPPDAKFKVLVRVVPRGILSKLCHRMNTSLYT